MAVELIKTEVDMLHVVECDRCGLDLKFHELERQECLSWQNTGGFGSIFGDGAMIRIDLCQSCVQSVLGEWLDITN
jgi:hypothetical protein